jgi:hypothetical protein
MEIAQWGRRCLYHAGLRAYLGHFPALARNDLPTARRSPFSRGRNCVHAGECHPLSFDGSGYEVEAGAWTRTPPPGLGKCQVVPVGLPKSCPETLNQGRCSLHDGWKGSFARSCTRRNSLLGCHIPSTTASTLRAICGDVSEVGPGGLQGFARPERQSPPKFIVRRGEDSLRSIISTLRESGNHNQGPRFYTA